MKTIDGLRGGYDVVGGLAHFGRMLDKIRLQAAGALPEGYAEYLGEGTSTAFDGRLCRFLRVSYSAVCDRALQGGSDEEIMEWAFVSGRRPTEEQIQIMTSFLHKRGWRDDASDELRVWERQHSRPAGSVATFCDQFDVEEGRPAKFPPDPKLDDGPFARTVDLRALRSPYEQFDGVVHVPRMIDKIRLHRQGKLPEEWVKLMGAEKGYDGMCCRFLGISYDAIKERIIDGASDIMAQAWIDKNGSRPSDEEKLIWSASLRKRGWRDAHHERLQQRLKESGFPPNAAFTMFDFIDIDEGRVG